MTPEIKNSIDYLKSPDAVASLKANPYWPKWDSPWWHMLLLHEMGMNHLIPTPAIQACVDSLNAGPVKIFPLLPSEVPPGVDLYQSCFCHCQLGNIYQIFAAHGVDVDAELPWIRPWFLRYQMPDGGMNCDDTAYLVKDEVPSSMVGMIAAFEAVLIYTPRPWTPSEIEFLDRGAQFLIKRELRLGSPTKHNASERESAAEWTKLCFPRFYLYDVLRGLDALSLWAEKRGKPLPAAAIQNVMNHLETESANGKLRNRRHSYAGVGTRLQSSSGEWTRSPNASTFALMNEVSRIGDESEFLTKQWQTVKARVASLTSE